MARFGCQRQQRQGSRVKRSCNGGVAPHSTTDWHPSRSRRGRARARARGRRKTRCRVRVQFLCEPGRQGKVAGRQSADSRCADTSAVGGRRGWAPGVVSSTNEPGRAAPRLGPESWYDQAVGSFHVVICDGRVLSTGFARIFLLRIGLKIWLGHQKPASNQAVSEATANRGTWRARSPSLGFWSSPPAEKRKCPRRICSPATHKRHGFMDAKYQRPRLAALHQMRWGRHRAPQQARARSALCRGRNPGLCGYPPSPHIPTRA